MYIRLWQVDELLVADTKVKEDEGEYILSGQISRLITWEDQRCSRQFLDSLPKSVVPLASGWC